MHKRIELRTNFVSWFLRHARHAEQQISDILRSQNPDRDKIAELRKIVENCREDARRYQLAACVCGNPVSTIR
jgi:hypothetical protein